MFPNRYLPGDSGVDVELVDYILYDSANGYDNTTLRSLSMPTGAKVGHFLMLFTKGNNDAYLSANALSNLDTAGWNKLCPIPSDITLRVGLLEQGFDMTGVYYKFAQESDLTTPLQLSPVATTKYVAYAIFSFKNVDTEMPFYAPRFHGGAFGTSYPGYLGFPLTYHDRGNKIFVHTAQSSATDDAWSDMYDETMGPPSILQLDNWVQTGISKGFNRFFFYGPDSDYAAENIVPFTGTYGVPNLSDWTTFNASVQGFASNPQVYVADFFVAGTTDNSEHYAQFPFGMTAGQTYVIAVRVGRHTSSNPVICVEKDGTKWGTYLTSSVYRWAPIPASFGTFEPFDFVTYDAINTTTTGISYNNIVYIKFTAPETGTYNIRFYLFSTALSQALNTFYYVAYQNLTIVRTGSGGGIPHGIWYPKARETEFPRHETGPLFTAGTGGSYCGAIAYELHKQGAPIPAVKLDPWLATKARSSRIFATASDENGLVFTTPSAFLAGGEYGVTQNGNGRKVYWSNICVFPPSQDPNTPSKLYFEYTAGAATPGGVDNLEHGVGITAAGAWQAGVDATAWTSGTTDIAEGTTGLALVSLDWAGNITAKDSGLSPVAYTLGSTLTDGDVVSFAVDFNTGTVEISKNGVLYTANTLYFSTDTPLVVGVWEDPGIQLCDWSINLTGPFTHKDMYYADYSAWDWRNEV